MKRIDIRHRFLAAARTDVERLYMLDDVFNARTFAELGFTRRVVSFHREGDRLSRVLRLCPHRALPAPFSALVPNGMFQITEQVTYDFESHRGSWKTIPSVLAKQFRAEGTLALDELPEGVVFRLEGEVSASIPLLGGRAERQAADTAVAQHAALAVAVARELEAERTARTHAAAPL